MGIKEFKQESLKCYTNDTKKYGRTINGGLKHTNEAWKIICCEFSREMLDKKPTFTDKAVYQAGIYMLIGYDVLEHCPVTKIYVGSADVRNDNTSFLSRNNEHRSKDPFDVKSKRNKFFHEWEIALWFTHEDNIWGSTEAKYLENYFKNALYEENCSNSVTPSKGAGEVSNEVIRQIIGHINNLGYASSFDIDIKDKKEAAGTKISESNKLNLQDGEDADSKITIDLKDEFYSISNYTTPRRTVKEMIRMLPEEIFNKNTRMIDLACKGGETLYELYQRYFHSKYMIEFEKNDFKRASYIINKQVFGVALSKKSYENTCKVLYHDGAEVKNIVLADRNYIDIIKGYKKISTFHNLTGELVTKEYKTKETLRDYLAERFREKDNKGESKAVEFDVIIGNPPYNDEESRGEVGSGNSIYPYFMEKALELTKKYSCLIVPSGWMMQYPSGVKHDTVNKLRKSGNIVELHDYKDAKDIFENVSIPSGVCFYLSDKDDESGLCNYYSHESKQNIKEYKGIELCNKEASVIFRDEHIIRISNKIREVHKKEKRFNEICAGAKHHFDDGKKIMTSTWNEYSVIETPDNNIRYFLKSNNKVHKNACTEYKTEGLPSLGYCWVNEKQVPRNMLDISRPKILVGQAFTAGSSQVMDVPEYVGTNCVCSQSFIPIFSPNDNEEECLNICKYIKSRLFRYLVNCMKNDQNLGNITYCLVPMQNFTSESDIDWSQSIADIDKQLYKKYNLTEEEIAYIEQTIKPMA